MKAPSISLALICADFLFNSEMKKDLVSMADLTSREVWQLLDRGLKLKAGGQARPILTGKTLALVFQKPSLRTRVSFEIGIRQLGGYAIYLSPQEIKMGERESATDISRVLSRYVNGIVARTFSHTDVVEMARQAWVPVINGLSDEEHPCQALADLLTIYEKKGRLEGLHIVFIGDGNNVAASLALASVLVGAKFTLVCPPGYDFKGWVLEAAKKTVPGSPIYLKTVSDPQSAIRAADVVYTDVWTSMGQEKETEKRREAFKGFQVTPELMAQAGRKALFMHPLPAHHGEEICDGMLDHPQSVVYDQAENRLHAQKAVLAELLTAIPARPDTE